MKGFIKKIGIVRTVCVFLSALRLLPHILLWNIHPNKSIIKYDIQRWLKCHGLETNSQLGFIYYMTFHPEYRNLFYYRLGPLSHFIKWLCPKMSTLFIETKEIGPGLFIEHGFATMIGAKSIGKNCYINQQVTIGYSNETDLPTLGDNVEIKSGAQIIGNVHMGNNSIAGANAVVVKNVPANCTVVGVPAYIIKRNGLKVKEAL